MARSFRSRCFNLLIFIKMSLCFYRWSSRQDADCFAALDINNVEQTPVYCHPDDGSRGSPSTKPASTTRRIGSKNASQAVAKETLCLRRFVLDFRSSHSNVISCKVKLTFTVGR